MRFLFDVGDLVTFETSKVIMPEVGSADKKERWGKVKLTGIVINREKIEIENSSPTGEGPNSYEEVCFYDVRTSGGRLYIARTAENLKLIAKGKA